MSQNLQGWWNGVHIEVVKTTVRLTKTGCATPWNRSLVLVTRAELIVNSIILGILTDTYKTFNGTQV